MRKVNVPQEELRAIARALDPDSRFNQSFTDYFKGRRVVSIGVDDKRQHMKFVLDDGSTVGLRVEGDCCSTSWLSEFNGMDALEGEIFEVLDVEMASISNHPVHDSLESYGIKFFTDRGIAFLVHRNSSNGYYGGSCYISNHSPSDIEFSEIDMSKEWSS